MTITEPTAGVVTSFTPLTIDPADLDIAIGGQFVGAWIEVDLPRVQVFHHATFTSDNAVPMEIDLYPEGLLEGFNSIGLLDRLHQGVFDVAAEPGPTRQTWSKKLRAIRKIRWTSRIEAGQLMRARGAVTGATKCAEGFLLDLDIVVEVLGREKPGLVIQWSQLWQPTGAQTTAAAIGAESALATAVGQATDNEDLLVVTTPFELIPTMAGRPFRGEWITVDQGRRWEWAVCTSAAGDELNHYDPDDDVLKPAHVLALLEYMCNRVVNVDPGPWWGWNYGLDGVVFGDDVRVGERVRLTGTVESVATRSEGFVPCFAFSVEAAGRPDPVLTGRWRAFWLPPEDHS
ncbi:hypothetical protein [Mycolicibacterium sp. CBMA 226]|uniref:hypothetical protein n=1 Tax=Mycolicibacterium sp. CBMA 226 TaxID=2606611 RepID=UPI0012DF38E5|nr:hypothetical protein [Mycolicibacterium sp. CBMA 226]MUL79036.1 hypothetical protein [Mycolicibacterium sp. CBMA 226]QGW61358.1 hypothetical protein ICEMyc226_00326 [Mycolicibacterium sp.]